MSWRTYIGIEKIPWADFDLDEFPRLEDLAKEAAWQMPAKLGLSASHTGMATEFLDILNRDHSMETEEFSSIWIIGMEALHHPSMDEVREYFAKYGTDNKDPHV